MAKFTIRWKDCDKSKSIQSYFEDKLSILAKYAFLNENIKAEIVYYSKTKTFKTRINVSIKRGKMLRAEASASQIITSINLALDKIEDQIRRVKTKMLRNKK